MNRLRNSNYILPTIAGVAAFTVGFLAVEFGAEEGPQVNKDLPATITALHSSIARGGNYINGVWYDDPDTPASIDVKQCPDQNPEITQCIDGSVTATDDLVASLAINQVVIFSSIIATN